MSGGCSYREIIHELLELERDNPFAVTEIGVVVAGITHYPIYKIEIKSNPDKNADLLPVFISAGIHGDEPAGVWAALEFLKRYPALPAFYRNIQFTILPCMNPYGYEHKKRVNAQGLDLNRQFRTGHPPAEVRFVKEVVGGWAYALAMEFHEDVDSPGFYLYELTQGGEPSWGREIIELVAQKFPINLNREIEGTSAEAGLILRQDGNTPFYRMIKSRTDWPQAFYHYTNGTPHCFTTETPVFLNREERTEIHLMALDVAVKNLWEQQKRPGL
jgi:murein peptide amidase A